MNRRYWIKVALGSLLTVPGLFSTGNSARSPGPRYFAISAGTSGAGVSGRSEADALRTPYPDYRFVREQLAAGDVVVFMPGIYRLTESVRLADGIRYQASSGATAPVVIDAAGRVEHCISGSGCRDVVIDGFTCMNARFNGIDIHADPHNGRLPRNIVIRNCECSFNGTEEVAVDKLWHEQGNGIAIHTGRGFRVPLETDTRGFLVENCDAYCNAHAGILIDLPGTGHCINGCRAGNNGQARDTNAWAILVRPPGGKLPASWRRAGKGVLTRQSPRFRFQVPARVISTRIRSIKGGRWLNEPLFLDRAKGSQNLPAPGQFGFVENEKRGVGGLYVNPGPVAEFQLVVNWIGECREPVIEDCEAWGQGGDDGVGIGFDQNVIDGTIRKCTSRSNKRGFSLHINDGGSILDSEAVDNREYGIKADRNMGRFTIRGNRSSNSGRAEFYLQSIGASGRAILEKNTADTDSVGFMIESQKGDIHFGDGDALANRFSGGGKQLTSPGRRFEQLGSKIRRR